MNDYTIGTTTPHTAAFEVNGEIQTWTRSHGDGIINFGDVAYSTYMLVTTQSLGYFEMKMRGYSLAKFNRADSGAFANSIEVPNKILASGFCIPSGTSACILKAGDSIDTSGVSGTFTTVDGKTITITNGVCTSIV